MLFAFLASWVSAQAPEVLRFESGEELIGTVARMEGTNVVITYEGVETSVPFARLNQDSQVAVMQWVLPLLVGREQFIDIRTVMIDGSKPYYKDHRVILENNSPVALPPGIELDYNLYVVTFRGKNGDSSILNDGEQYTYEFDGAKTYSFKTRFSELGIGQTFSFDTPMRGYMRESSIDWDTLAAGQKHIFRSREIPQRMPGFGGEENTTVRKTTSTGATKMALKLRFKLHGQVVHTYTSPNLAERFIKDLWTEPTLLSDEEAEPEKPENNEPAEAATALVAATPAPPEPDDSPAIPFNSIVIMDVDGGSGTGFLLEIKGRKFLVTNTHVIAGAKHISAKTLNGERIQLPQQFYIAKERDLAILPVDHEGEYLEAAENLSGSVKIGDRITVFGNEAGASVATKLTGAVRGIGPDRVEVDAKFVEGNSGSPAIHHQSGKVIGLATYYIEYEIPKADQEEDARSAYPRPNHPNSANETETTKRRRFAERIDNVSEWESTSLHALKAQADAIKQYEDCLAGTLKIAIGITRENRVIKPSEAPKVLENLLEDFHKYYDASRSAGSLGNQRALEQFKGKIARLMESERLTAKRSISTPFFLKEHERLVMLEKKLNEYLGGVYTY